jgi:hypothetical protein
MVINSRTLIQWKLLTGGEHLFQMAIRMLAVMKMKCRLLFHIPWERELYA